MIKTKNLGERYKNCKEMIALYFPNYVTTYPYAKISENGLEGSVKLKSIKIPNAQSLGHYTFTGLPSLEWLELGSVGNPWKSGGWFMGFPTGAYYNGRNFGSPAGLTVEAYMTKYSATAGFSPGGPASNTNIIIRSSETGEVLSPEVTN